MNNCNQSFVHETKIKDLFQEAINCFYGVVDTFDFIDEKKRKSIRLVGEKDISGNPLAVFLAEKQNENWHVLYDTQFFNKKLVPNPRIYKTKFF